MDKNNVILLLHSSSDFEITLQTNDNTEAKTKNIFLVLI